jgi:hypothetical protein
MSVVLLDGANPHSIWPGHADMDRAGVELAIEMLRVLEEGERDDGIAEGDYCCLEDWPRQGGPFRNIVVEYMARAREAGSGVENAFCAVITDYLALGSLGSGVRSAEFYADMYEVDT